MSSLTPLHQTPSPPPIPLSVLCLRWVECDLLGNWLWNHKQLYRQETQLAQSAKSAEPARRWGAILPHTSSPNREMMSCSAALFEEVCIYEGSNAVMAAWVQRLRNTRTLYEITIQKAIERCLTLLNHALSVFSEWKRRENIHKNLLPATEAALSP